MATIDWAEVHRSTKPANKPVAERALRELYRLRGLKRPDVIWVASPAEGVEICRDPKTPPAITSAHPRLTSSFLHSCFRLEFEALADPFWISPRRADGLDARISRQVDEISPAARVGAAEGTRWLLRRALGTHLVPDGNFDRPWTPRCVPRPRASRRCSSVSSTACWLPPATSASNVAGRPCPVRPGYPRTCRSSSATLTSRGPPDRGGHAVGSQSSPSDPWWPPSTIGVAFMRLTGRHSDTATVSRYMPSPACPSRLESSRTQVHHGR